MQREGDKERPYLRRLNLARVERQKLDHFPKMVFTCYLHRGKPKGKAPGAGRGD